MKALTYKQYKIINVLLLAVIFYFIETLIALGANLWFSELPYVLSLAVLYTAIEMMRWNFSAVVAAVTNAVALCMASGADWKQFVIYGCGNLLMLLGVFFLKAVGKERVRNNPLLTMAYAIIVYILAGTGRWLVSMMFGADSLVFVSFLTTDSLSCLFAVTVLLIIRKTEGVFEDQKQYLLRLERERREKEENGGY